jgi:cytochrome c oxidase cbb3-type subunit 3
MATGGAAQTQRQPPAAAGAPQKAPSGADGKGAAQPTEASAGALLKTPVTGIYPGAVPPPSTVENPVANDPGAPARGMQYFLSMNCVGCHAANGGGGMGPALSDRFFLYGSAPAQIFLTIAQGRPNGMPAWGFMLPDDVIWDLVSYVQEISKAPITQWGTTISRKADMVEQVPSEFQATPSPWKYTEPFSNGQKPPVRKESQ